jgi:hypothetical protein
MPLTDIDSSNTASCRRSISESLENVLMVAIERLERPLHIGDFCPPGVWPVWKLLAGTKVD